MVTAKREHTRGQLWSVYNQCYQNFQFLHSVTFTQEDRVFMSLPWYLHKSGQKLGLNPNRLSRPSERHPASSSCLTSPATFPHPLPPPLPNKHETYIHSYKQSMHNQILTARSAANPIIWLLNQGIIYWDTEMVPIKVKLLCWCVGDNPTIQLFSNDHPLTIFYFQLWNLIVTLSCFFITDCDVLINFIVAKCGVGGGGGRPFDFQIFRSEAENLFT